MQYQEFIQSSVTKHANTQLLNIFLGFKTDMIKNR